MSPIVYMGDVIEVRQTDEFGEWIAELNDRRAAARIAARIDRVRQGNFGDSKSVGGGVSELRIDYGPGYRVYFTRKGQEVVVLLCGGDKSDQQSDINKAKDLASKI